MAGTPPSFYLLHFFFGASERTGRLKTLASIAFYVVLLYPSSEIEVNHSMTHSSFCSTHLSISSLMSNSFNLTFETLGRSWTCYEAYFLQTRNEGPRTLQGPASIFSLFTIFPTSTCFCFFAHPLLLPGSVNFFPNPEAQRPVEGGFDFASIVFFWWVGGPASA